VLSFVVDGAGGRRRDPSGRLPHRPAHCEGGDTTRRRACARPGRCRALARTAGLLRCSAGCRHDVDGTARAVTRGQVDLDLAAVVLVWHMPLSLVALQDGRARGKPSRNSMRGRRVAGNRTRQRSTTYRAAS
jgi:hypothetical protein